MHRENDLVRELDYETDCLSLYPCHPTQEYTGIDLSWQQRHLQMTPLFAATLASQPGQTQSEAYSGTGEGMLRATQQAMAFTPTQGAYQKKGYVLLLKSL